MRYRPLEKAGCLRLVQPKDDLKSCFDRAEKAFALVPLEEQSLGVRRRVGLGGVASEVVEEGLDLVADAEPAGHSRRVSGGGGFVVARLSRMH